MGIMKKIKNLSKGKRKSLTMELLHKQLEPVIMYDLDRLKDCFIFKNREDFDYHFKLLKGNLKDLFDGVVR